MAIDRRPVFRISFKENPDTFSGCPEEFYTQGFSFYRQTLNGAVDIGYRRFIFEYPAGSRLQNNDGSPSKRTSSQWTALKKLSDSVPVDATSYENEGTFPNGANSSAISGINPNNIDYQVSLSNFILAQRERYDLLNDPLEICFRVGFDMSLFENNPFTMENSVPLNLLDNEPPSYSVDNPDNPDEPTIIQTVITPRQWVESNWKPLFDLTSPDANGNKKMFVDGVFESAESEAFFREISAWIDGQYGVKLVPLANETTSDSLSLVNRRYYFEDGVINGNIIDNSSVEAYADVGLVDAYEAAQKSETWAYCQQTYEIIPHTSPIGTDFINYIIRGVYPSPNFQDRAGVFRPNGPVNYPQPSSNSQLEGYDPDIILGDIPTVVSRPVSALQLIQDVVNKGFIPVVSDSSANVNQSGGVVELGSAINLFNILNNDFQGSQQHPNDIEPGSIKPYNGHKRTQIFGLPEFSDLFCESCSECRDSINSRYFSLEFDPLNPVSTLNLDPRISDITNKYAFL